ncbi:hypothetical protein PENSPDRAFT_672532 [Peniophora sp. CONT]|nr:hypothetical protein PENSPDRAFT_672532 [Peniophora sp. CONT]
MASSPPPVSYPAFLDQVIQYTLQKAEGIVEPPSNISVHLCKEIDHIVNTVLVAQSNRSKVIEFSAEPKFDSRFSGQNGKNLAAEATLRRQFPPLNRSINEPAVIDDVYGDIVAYYLPDALLPFRQPETRTNGIAGSHTA